VFNAHHQFEKLREEGRYARMQEVIRCRERNLQGTLNPNLADFGTSSEARQYSGRPVEEEWRCPFHALQASDPRTETPIPKKGR
jgi:FPC/CPF motif-containing protein YcgG